MKSNHYSISQMTRSELDVAIQWATCEGWNPGLHDADCFYAADNQGFFAGKLDGEIIAVGSAVVYDPTFAFCGFYRVAPNYRGQGYGLALTKARLAYVNFRNAGLDGVTSMLEKYSRLGYRVAHTNARYSGIVKVDSFIDPAIKPLTTIDFNQLVDYDRYHFPAKRPAFLKTWINQPDSLALAYCVNEQLRGYGLIRSCLEGYKIGPLFADTPQIADHLFLALAAFAKQKIVYLDIAENNPAAIALATRYQLTKVFETSRMYLKGEPQLRKESIFGITTFELG